MSLHDATLDRTARGRAENCTGPVANKTLAQLRTCEVGSWFGEQFAGAPIPTLSEAFARYPDVNHHVEVKDGDARTVRELLRLLDVHGLRGAAHTRWQVLMQSFQPDDLLLVRTLDPALPTIQLLAAVPPAGSARTALLEGVARYADGIGPSAGGVDRGLVDAAHARCCWLLELPVSADTHEELHRPLRPRSSVPPKELTDLVRSRTRGAQLVPVVQLGTERRVVQLLDADDRVLAEVSDDTASGQVLLEPDAVVWRQVEVELFDGPAALLDTADTLLQRAGAVPVASPSELARTLGERLPPRAPDRLPARPTAGQALQLHLAEQVGELLARDPGVRRDEPDSVHKMRVATRRLRSALSTFGPLLDREATDPVRDELGHLAAVLGEARDAEVLRERLLGAVHALPPELVLGPVARRVEDDLGPRYRAAHDRVVRELDGARHRTLLDTLDRLLVRTPLGEAAARPARAELRRLVRRAWRRLERAVEAAGRTADPLERAHLLHEVRKQAKRTRYAAEAAAPVLGQRAARLARRAEAVQEVLGEHQDSVVAREQRRRLGAAAHGPGENGFSFGLLHAREAAAADAAVARFDGVWSRASARKAVLWLG